MPKRANRKQKQKQYRVLPKYIRPTIDPALREAVNCIVDMSAREIAENSWVHPSTWYAIRNGKTKRPQNLTIEGLLHAAGYHRVVMRRRAPGRGPAGSI